MWNSRLSAIADPITSARSQATIAISAPSQSTKLTLRPKASWQTCARSRSVATPSFRLRLCNRIAIRFDAMMTNSSVYPNREPPAMSVAQLPGSMYPTEIRDPGPRNPNNRRQKIGEREMRTLACTSGKEGSMGSARILDSADMDEVEGPRGLLNPSMPRLVNYG